MSERLPAETLEIFKKEIEKLQKKIVKIEKESKDSLKSTLVHLKISTAYLGVNIGSYWSNCSKFDFENIEFNGYRTILTLIFKALKLVKENLAQVSKAVQLQKSKNLQEFQEIAKIYLQLVFIFQKIKMVMEANLEEGSLFGENCFEEFNGLLRYLNFQEFYGNYQGFYFCANTQSVLKMLCSGQFSLVRVFMKKKKLDTISELVMGSWENVMDDDKRKRVYLVNKLATVNFFQMFWNLLSDDKLKCVRGMAETGVDQSYYKKIDISKYINKDIEEDMRNRLKNLTDKTEVGFQFISFYRREGMLNKNGHPIKDKLLKPMKPPSDYLLFHIHGGGFIAQHPNAHEMYLRIIAKNLHWPIISIDYSLAPQNPYPRALIECICVYLYVLDNCSSFGCNSSPEKTKIVFMGDSAGGNLVLATILYLIHLKLTAKSPNIILPQGMLLAYPALLLEHKPSPARVLSCFDPLLHIGVLSLCMIAYNGCKYEEIVKAVKAIPPTAIEQDEFFGSMKEAVTIEHPLISDLFKSNYYHDNGDLLFYNDNHDIKPIDLISKTPVVQDPFYSPFYASEEMFKELPKVSIVVGQCDPLLDDSIEFCKSAKKNGTKSITLDVFPTLNHGFLNFANSFSQENYDALKFVINKLKTLAETE